jgi:hypothetical protein
MSPRRMSMALAVAIACAAPGIARAADVHVHLGAAPPAPVIAFDSEPSLLLVPRTRVYTLRERADDYSLFRYGGRWYLFDDGWWYRSSDYDGPYRAVAASAVPGVVMRVPRTYWTDHWSAHPHGGPPGLTKKRGGHPGKGKGR